MSESIISKLALGFILYLLCMTYGKAVLAMLEVLKFRKALWSDFVWFILAFVGLVCIISIIYFFIWE